MTTSTYDVAVVGGGAVGLASAFRLAGEKLSVAVFDAGELGREASWAGGGILSPIHPYAYPRALSDLVDRSTALYPELAHELLDVTGTSIELRRTGLLRLALDDSDEADLARIESFRGERGLATSRATDLRAFGAGISSEARGAVFEPDIAQIRNPRLLKALVAGCARRGVELLPHEPVAALVREGDRVVGVRTARRTVVAGETILAAGAWSGELARSSLGLELGVSPIRGQMLLVEGAASAVETMVLGAGGRYLIPRADGRILVGSTLEDVGFDRRTTIDGVHGLLTAALRLAPGLARGHLARAWGGLRPATPDRLPFIGRPLGTRGIVLATGHYRNGLVLTPITAALVADVVADRPSQLDLAPFAPHRKLANLVAD